MKQLTDRLLFEAVDELVAAIQYEPSQESIHRVNTALERLKEVADELDEDGRARSYQGVEGYWGIENLEAHAARALLIPDAQVTEETRDDLVRSAWDTYRTVRDEEQRIPEEGDFEALLDDIA